MVDLGKKYKLKRQYKLGVEENCNYILSYTGIRCVFLNPLPAFVLNSVLKSDDLFHTAHELIAKELVQNVRAAANDG